MNVPETNEKGKKKRIIFKLRWWICLVTKWRNKLFKRANINDTFRFFFSNTIFFHPFLINSIYSPRRNETRKKSEKKINAGCHHHRCSIGRPIRRFELIIIIIIITLLSSRMRKKKCLTMSKLWILLWCTHTHWSRSSLMIMIEKNKKKQQKLIIMIHWNLDVSFLQNYYYYNSNDFQIIIVCVCV